MLFSELELEDKFKSMLDEENISELYPPQQASVENGILDGNNLIICTPTASGKTIAAELAMMRALAEGKKVVYVVPLKALAYEKYNEFQKYKKLGYNIDLEVGDLDSSRYRKKHFFDIMVATAEKCDSILRSKPEWFNNVGVLVLDEIHLIATDRGPVYEVITTRLLRLLQDLQVIGLSATVGNANELAEWLDAKLVSSEWRPVELKENVAVGKSIDTIKKLVKEVSNDGGQLYHSSACTLKPE